MKMMIEQFKHALLLLLTESEASKLRNSLGRTNTCTKNHYCEHSSARASKGKNDSGTKLPVPLSEAVVVVFS